MATKAVPNLVQGVSQQAEAQRRDTQCQAQFDCINSVATGATARPPMELLTLIPGVDISGAFIYGIQRKDEHYAIVIKGGAIKAYNLTTGAVCTVTYTGAAQAYLANAAPQDGFCAQALEDYVMIANKATTVAMKTDLSASRPPEALIFVKAGNYTCLYKITVKIGATTYTCQLTTADADEAGDEARIQTGVIAAGLESLLKGVVPVVGTFTGMSTTFPTTGSTVERTGSVLRFTRTAATDFTITSESGNADANLRAFKTYARAVTDLPRIAFDGFILKVRGAERSANDDYYIQYKSAGDDGFWEEVVAPATPYLLDPATMPHGLFNSAPNTFVFQEMAWSSRIAGDDNTAKVPSFVGRPIQHLSYSFSRFQIVVETGSVWSKSRKPFTFFRDTVQLLLATEAVDINVPATPSSRGPSFVEKAVSMKEGNYLWSQRTQFRITGGDQGFEAKTVEDKPDTNFEFASAVDPIGLGGSLFWPVEVGRWVTVRNMPFENGRAQDVVDVTRHVSHYIPSGIRGVAAHETLGLQFWWTDGAPGSLFTYNWLLSDKAFAQSAWNTWRIPGGKILWADVKGAELTVLQQRGTGFAILKLDLSEEPADDDVDGAVSQIRLDIRVRETQCTALAYTVSTGKSVFTLPYTPAAGVDDFFVVAADGSAGYNRGKSFPVTDITGRVVTVRGDLTGVPFYAGERIDARRVESRFSLKDQQGSPQAPESLTVGEYRLVYDRTGYTRLELTTPNGNFRKESYDGHTAGYADSGLGEANLRDGTLRLAIQEAAENATVTLINDSYLPSRWQSATWVYSAVLDDKSTRGR